MAGQPTGEHQDGIPIADAAALLGLSAEAVRKRIQRGTLDGHKRAGHWFVVIERQDVPSGRQDAGRTERQDAPPVEAAYRVTPAEIEQAVSRTSAQYMGDLRTMLAEVGKVYEGQLAAKDETIAMQREVLATKDETIAELRRRAEVAEAGLARRHEAETRAVELLRRRDEQERLNRERAQAAQDGPGATAASTPDNPSGAASAGFWARVRRVFGGG